MEQRFDYLEKTRKIFDKGIFALEKMKTLLGADFEDAVVLILNCQGKPAFMSVGKAGHIAAKMAAAFAGFGMPVLGKQMQGIGEIVMQDIFKAGVVR